METAEQLANLMPVELTSTQWRTCLIVFGLCQILLGVGLIVGMYVLLLVWLEV